MVTCLQSTDPIRPAMEKLSLLFFIISLMGCGGGSGGAAPMDGIALLSITFPGCTDLTGATPIPPSDAPLIQQVVFTFSGLVQGPVSSNAILITATPEADYSGPEIALDKSKNVIPARGTFEIFHNIVVFTPFIPTGEIDLSLNAKTEHVPGLLPGYSYNVFVPVGTTGFIENLKGVDASVANPVSFTTISPDLPALFFSNHPAVPPEVVSLDPADGSEDFPVGTFSLDGLLGQKAILVEFDQPLDFTHDNLEGVDRNNNGLRDQNLFLGYTEPMLYMAVASGEGYLAGLNRETNEFELLGYTYFGSENVKLQAIALTETFAMIGCDGARLFDVNYEEPSGTPPICALTNERTLNGGVDAKGLVFTRGNDLYAIDAKEGQLIYIDPVTGEVEKKGVLTPGLGDFVDLALGLDNELYGLRVYSPGTLNAVSSVERIDRETLKGTPLVSNLPFDYSSMVFSRDGHAALFDANGLDWIELALATGQVVAGGGPISDPLLPSGSRPDLCVRRFELGVNPILVDNSYHGASVRIEPSGILPFGAWIDIMQRFSLKNLGGGSLAENHGSDPLGALSTGRFKTHDPGPQVLDDHFLEHFLDNIHEDMEPAFAHSRAVWNIQDMDGAPPKYEHLLAGLGLSGGGELGDFVPDVSLINGVFLDTNYQPLPLYNGATPDIHKPMVVVGGEFHFHDIIIPNGVKVVASGLNPLVLTATGRVEIGGTIDVSALNGENVSNYNSAFIPAFGGPGGAGGGRGGMGQPPIPSQFKSLSQLQSVPRGERGWGPGNQAQIGGQGGESGAKGPDVPYSWGQDPDSRGGGGGGGSYASEGREGYPGLGKWGVDEQGNFYVRDPWYYWDGSYEWDGSGNWKPGDPYTPKINEFLPEEDHRHPRPGKPGEKVFKDGDPDNDFIGPLGELKMIQGGQGGGGGGSRLDSLNPTCKNKTWPGYPNSMWDGKGGGGGGGGGGVAIHSLGEIVIRKTGRILARGGRGGGGEANGCGNIGGSGGGGSGGAIILNSAERIFIEHDNDQYGVLDVSGGWGGDSSMKSGTTTGHLSNPCMINKNTGNLQYVFLFCSWSKGDGGYGSYGLIQLMVPDPSDIDQLDYNDDSIMATICKIEHEPNYKKTNGLGFDGFARYHYTVEGLGPGGTSPFIQFFPKSPECLVPVVKTPATIAPETYAVSEWIDMGCAILRPSIGGVCAPVFMDFEGIKAKDAWGVVDTKNGYVVNAHIADYNDIEVDAPDLWLDDYIPDTNEVAIQFQGTDAVIPGSKIPDEDPGVTTPWTCDLSSLNGSQFFRFRIRFDVAKNTKLTPSSYKPQVNKVRIRTRL